VLFKAACVGQQSRVCTFPAASPPLVALEAVKEFGSTFPRLRRQQCGESLTHRRGAPTQLSRGSAAVGAERVRNWEMLSRGSAASSAVSLWLTGGARRLNSPAAPPPLVAVSDDWLRGGAAALNRASAKARRRWMFL